MSKPLTRTTQKIYHYVDGVKVDGAHDRITGDVTDLWGDMDEIPDSARPCDISDWIEE
jgi:hypothetical protein